MMKVRMMLPMSIRCGTCGTYMYKGTKFNTRKEDVEGENYLGIQVFRYRLQPFCELEHMIIACRVAFYFWRAVCVSEALKASVSDILCTQECPVRELLKSYVFWMWLRFYFRCSACAAEISMKTDPENSDYTMEQGASRNYEPWREKDKEVAQAKAQREEEEKGNAMKVTNRGYHLPTLLPAYALSADCLRIASAINLLPTLMTHIRGD